MKTDLHTASGDRASSVDASVTKDFIERLRAFVRRRVGSNEDADDITQNVLLKFVREGDAVKPGRGPAWMFQVARREIIDRHRRSGLAAGEIDPETTATPGRQDPAVIAELAACVQPLIGLLSREDREILDRVDLRGEAQSAIADAMGVPRSTIKARVQRARERFHQQLLGCCAIELDALGVPLGIEPRGPGCGVCNGSAGRREDDGGLGCPTKTTRRPSAG